MERKTYQEARGFAAGDVVRVQDERGTFTIKWFATDSGGEYAVLISSAGGTRCINSSRLVALTKRKKATIGEQQ